MIIDYKNKQTKLPFMVESDLHYQTLTYKYIYIEVCVISNEYDSTIILNVANSCIIGSITLSPFSSLISSSFLFNPVFGLL